MAKHAFFFGFFLGYLLNTVNGREKKEFARADKNALHPLYKLNEVDAYDFQLKFDFFSRSLENKMSYNDLKLRKLNADSIATIHRFSLNRDSRKMPDSALFEHSNSLLNEH